MHIFDRQNKHFHCHCKLANFPLENKNQLYKYTFNAL